MSFFQIGLILVTGIFAGFLNALGGGGSLITLPLLIFLGLPPTIANGTNRISTFSSSIMSVLNFRYRGYFYPRLSIILGIPAIIGSIIGARVGVFISEKLFEKILAIMMIFVLIVILSRPGKKNEREIIGEKLSTIRIITFMIIFFGIGFYGGFIQIGIGFLIIVALSLFSEMSLIKINSLKIFIVLIYTVFSLPVYIINNKVNFTLGIILAIGSAVGGYIGSNFVVDKGDKWIRFFLVCIILVMSAKLLGFFEFINF